MLVTVTGIFTQQALGQVSEDFSDGEFTSNPAWSGSSAHFTVNALHQLQLMNTAAGTSYLSVPFSFSSAQNVQWEFFVKQTFAGSASNFGRVYLASSQQDLTSPLNGYYLQFGEAGTNDAVELFRQTGTSSVSVCRATLAQIASAVNARIRVTRSYAGAWTLFIDYVGGINFNQEATGVDATHTSGSFFGIRCTYTVANATRFFYDDISIVSHAVPDLLPPTVSAVSAHSSTTLDVRFSERYDPLTAQDPLNYLLLEGSLNPVSVTQQDDETIRLAFAAPFRNGYSQRLAMKGVKDLAGNVMADTTTSFTFFQPVPAVHKDIVITEIFADPSPSVGLPEAEFVELFNRSSEPFDLSGWQFTDGSTTGVLSTRILLPGEYLIVTTPAALSAFSRFGDVISISPFPSLNNTADIIRLKDPQGRTIDSVSYSAAWYHHDDKKDGGWTLELIDPYDLCKEEATNWTASVQETGGTPGVQNSVFAHVPDLSGPKLVSATALAADRVSLTFNERLDAALPAVTNFIVEPLQEIFSVSFVDENRTHVGLVFAGALDSAKAYTISVKDVFDCPGNIIQSANATVSFKLDTVRPRVESIRVVSARELIVEFSEKLNSTSAGQTAAFSISAQIVITSAAVLPDQSSVQLMLAQPLINGYENTIAINGITDLAANEMLPAEKKFMFFQPVAAVYKDVVITEIFADPAPTYGLPEAEFVEIFNRGEHPFDLKGWNLSDGSSGATLTNRILLPQQYLILCLSAKTSLFISFGSVMGTAVFPSLNNSGDVLMLRDAAGTMVDSVHYDATWYKDNEKKDGGYTLELIDPDNVCAEMENWVASEDDRGGTPGAQNSVFASKPDLTGPKLVSVFPAADTVLLLQFNEKLEKNLPLTDNFSITPTHAVKRIMFATQALTSVYLTLEEPMHNGVRYTLTATRVYDCAGNVLQPDFSSATFALPEVADSADVVINELLFNPRPTGVDFAELFNRSSKFINLKHWKLGNWRDGSLVNTTALFENDFLLEPQAYLVLTEDGNILKGEYPRAKEETFVQINLPSFPDDEGSAVLTNEKGKIIDAFSYSDQLHSVFFKEDEGVSLERISAWTSAHEAQNWKSASADAGFATPGYANANARAEGDADGAITVEPEIFIPLSGQPDFAQIRYHLDRGGYVANIRIIDAQGRQVKQLANNELLGTEGFFRWDGDLDSGQQARIGAYMIWVEVFDSTGEVKTFRKRVVVAGEF
ncbi:lamin tail domain-containing protein [Fulvivirgaceae bacterium PWU4]|uniref:Lamin tail domain-containing protein n=1 Tax=Chryseosolibacter histidini TaxID=2782349 RepID=A0AAP2GLD2_9BACT|nr:lamin tail domain-containing protein [Chryseosolibacter histidini]MBT1699999.1 lamin tail domain-containing protein [Chryseosolibacter histidini]